MSKHEFDRQAFRQDRHSYQTWQGDQRGDDAEDVAQSFDRDLFGNLLVYLADGYDSGTIAIRAVVFLLSVRPDLVSGGDHAQIAQKLGVSSSSLSAQLRIFRELLPSLALMPLVRTSRARLVALGDIRRRRRQLMLHQVEVEAAARLSLASDRVRKRLDAIEARRLRVARRTLELWDVIHLVEIASDREFNEALRSQLLPKLPDRSNASPLDAFEIERRQLLSRRGIVFPDENGGGVS